MLKKFLLLSLAAAIILLLLLPRGMFLVVRDNDNNVLVSQEVKAGDVIRYCYIHSVEKVPVTDTYVVCGDSRLMLANTTFGSSGAGLPTDSSYNLTRAGDDYLVEGIGKPFKSINFRIYAPSLCHVEVCGKDYPVYRMVEDQEAVTMSIESRALFNGIFY